MIHLVLDRADPYAFESLAKQMTPMIRRVVLPFTRDRMLARTEDSDSLTNLCLLKLYQAYSDFVYEPAFSEEHNERRFIALVRTYITRILIDQQYSANLLIRKPVGGIVSTAQLTGDEDDGEYEPHDTRQHTPYHVAVALEMRRRLDDALDEDEVEITNLLYHGCSAEDVARKLGMKISRVRYLIYSQIQPRARECCV